MDSSGEIGHKRFLWLLATGWASGAWAADVQGGTEEAWWGGLLLIVALLVGEALLSASEAAFLRLGINRARELGETAGWRGRWVQRLWERPTHLLATLLVSITTLLYFADAQATLWVSLLVGPGTQVVFLVPLIMAFLVTPFAEMAPILYGSLRSERVALFMAPLLRPLVSLLWPAVQVLTGIASLILRPLGIRRLAIEPHTTQEEIQEAILTGLEQGSLPPEQSLMLRSVFRFGDRVAKEIMVPRTEMVALPAHLPLAEAMERILATHYSRFPIYEGSLDNVVGILAVRDLLKVALEPHWEQRPIGELPLHTPLIVPESRPVAHLLREMQQAKVSIALVVDEFGGLEGLITIEDILEEVVGEIADEQAQEASEIQVLGPQRFRCKGTVDVERINELTGLTLPVEEGFETLAGFILHRLGRIPQPGEGVEYEGWVFQVESMRGHKIEWALLFRSEGEEG